MKLNKITKFVAAATLTLSAAICRCDGDAR